MRGSKSVWIIIGLLCSAAPAAHAQDLRPRLGETDAQYRARIGAGPSRAPSSQALLPKVGETRAEYEARMQGRPGMESAPGGVVEIRADRSGHYVAQASVGGEKLDMLVDTGASAVALPYEVAQRLGFRLTDADFRASAATANGMAKVAVVTLDEVQIGEIVVRNVSAFVGKPGALTGKALLGMSFLSKLQKYEIADGVLKLFR